MPQQILHRHLAPHRLGFQRLCGCIIGVNGDLKLSEYRDITRDRIGDEQFAFFRQHHRSDGGERLCHRCNAKDRIGRRGCARFAIAIAKGFQASDFSVPCNQHHGARDGARVDIRFQRIRQTRQAL
jgi:hypothetical protein